jgi:hypothetical protein
MLKPGKTAAEMLFPEYGVTILPRSPPRNRNPAKVEHFGQVCAGRIT